MPLPGALVIGPMKAGTSWIQDYLEWRGDVCVPAGVKETFFFDRYFAKGAHRYAERFAHFDPNRHALAIEVAPSLFHDAEAPSRVTETLGPIPLVVTLREPVARSWSHYLHLRRRGYTRADLPDAARRFPEIVEASRYEAQIARWRLSAQGAPIHRLSLEDLAKDPVGYAAALADVLQLARMDPPADLAGARNAGGEPPSYLLAKAGRRASHAVRGLGGDGFVNLAKRAGLKRVFFGDEKAGSTQEKLSPQERAWLAAALADEPSAASAAAQ